MPSIQTPGSLPAWTCCRIQNRDTHAMSAAWPQVMYWDGSIFIAASIADRQQVVNQAAPAGGCSSPGQIRGSSCQGAGWPAWVILGSR